MLLLWTKSSFGYCTHYTPLNMMLPYVRSEENDGVTAKPMRRYAGKIQWRGFYRSDRPTYQYWYTVTDLPFPRTSNVASVRERIRIQRRAGQQQQQQNIKRSRYLLSLFKAATHTMDNLDNLPLFNADGSKQNGEYYLRQCVVLYSSSSMHADHRIPLAYSSRAKTHTTSFQFHR